MQKYKSIIDKLSNTQKMDLVIRTSNYSKKIEGTNISSKEFYFDESFKDSSIFTCAASLDDKIVESFVLNNFNNDNSIYVFNIKNSNQKFSSIDYINNSYFKICFDALKKKNIEQALELSYVEHEIDKEYYLRNELEILKECSVKYVISNNYIDKDFIYNNSKEKPILLIRTEDADTICKCINNGYVMAFTNESIANEILTRLKNFKESLKQKRSGFISEEEFNLLISNGKILDEEKLNDAIDVLLEQFDTLSERNQTQYQNIIPDFYPEQTIMYKNDGILPIKDEDNITLIGEAAISNGFDLRIEASNYGLKCDYFLHGYSYEDINNPEILLEDAISKTASSIAVLFLEGVDCLDERQLKLLHTLHSQERRIVSVVLGHVVSEDIINCSNAVIEVPTREAYGRPLFDIIKGILNPSGKTLDYLICEDKDLDLSDETSYIYPPLHGLAYQNINISALEVFDDHFEFIAKNETNKKISNVYFLTLNDDLYDVLAYVRVYLKPHEVKRIYHKIKFNRLYQYDFSKHTYAIVGGAYYFKLTDGYNILDETKIDFNNKEIANDEEDTDFFLSNNESNTSIDIKNKKFKNIVILSTILYITVLFLILAIIYKNNTALFATFIVLFGISLFITNVFALRLLFRKKESNETKSIENVIKDMKVLTKESDIIFKKPIAHKKENKVLDSKSKDSDVVEENKEDNHNADNAIKDISMDEIENKTYDISDISIIEEDNSKPNFDEETAQFNAILNAKEVDIEILSINLAKYAESKGITTSLNSVKTLLSSLSSTRIIYINTNDDNLAKEFMKTMMEFFLNKENLLDLAEFNSFEEATHTPNSMLASFIKECGIDKDKMNFIYVFNSSNEKIDTILNPFIKQNEMNININVTINGEKMPLTKNSYFIINNKNLDKEDDDSFTIDISFAKTAEKLYDANFSELNISSFKNIINEYQNKLFLKEEYFKKFDEAANEIIFTKDKLLSNRTTIDFDKLYIMLNLAGLEDNEIQDILLRGRIVPQILKSDSYKNNKNEVLNIISKIFNKDLIPQSMKTLKNLEEVEND